MKSQHYARIKGMADRLENLRVQMYQDLPKGKHWNADDDRAMKELSDALFSIQSQIRQLLPTIEYLEQDSI